MASGIFDDALVKHLFSTDELRAIFNDRNKVQKWYDFEAALAVEQAALGIIPDDAAKEIAAKANVDQVDIEKIAAEIRRIKHPLIPAERVMFDLSDKVGKQSAHDLVYEASMHGIENGVTFEQSLMANEKIRNAMSADELKAALDPTTYIGHAEAIVERVVAAQRWVD